MMGTMRDAYQDALDRSVTDMVTMTRLVQTSVRRATHALLHADLEVADEVIAADDEVDRLREQIEEDVFELLALQQPVAGDLRMLFAAVRMVSDLERMGDLSVHVAKVARLRVPEVAVPEQMRPTMERMAEVAERMVGQTADIIANRDVAAARALEDSDEEMDQLRSRGFRIMLSPEWADGVEPAIDMALLGRYYERIADHAVSVARRVVYLVTGETFTTEVDTTL